MNSFRVVLALLRFPQVMGKPRLCVKGKIYNLGLSVVVAAGSQHKVAATTAATSPELVTSVASINNLAL